MRVTNIEPFNRGKDRVAVYIDNEFAFVLYKGELSKYELYVECELDTDKYNMILKEVIFLRAKKRGMNLLKTMDRTQWDVENKLREGGYPQSAIDVAIDYLKSFKYIDDDRYADDYIGYKKNQMSRKQIYAKLCEKGISKAVIERALLDAYDDEEDSEDELIRQIIVKRTKGNPGSLEYNQKQKLFAYLYNKGFRISAIERVYNYLT